MPRMAKPGRSFDGRSLEPEVSLTLSAAAARWALALKADNKSPATQRAYALATRTALGVLGDIPLAAVDPEALDRLFVGLQDRGLRPASISACERPLRSFMGWCVERGYLARNPFTGRKPVFVPVPTIEFPSPEDFARVLATTETRSRFAFRARRDQALLLIFAATGARLAEIAGLKLPDIDIDSRRTI